MRELFLIPATVLYLLVVILLFAYGLNFLYLTWIAWRSGRQAVAPEALPEPWTDWPAVTVQLPIYNELYVVERLVEAAARLDYPAGKLQIQLLDDSTDETTELAQLAAARWRAAGIDIMVQHRQDRQGYKAGALQQGMATATGEFIAIFDADFVPPPDFLQRTLPHFDAANVAFVQTRWGHLNRRYSLLTFLQSLALDAHFMIEQFARSRGAYLFNFNGTAGIWRKAALEAAGGWQADTLTEDLDISYRAYLQGWVGRYARDIVVPAELPVHFAGFRRQQHRWARGSLECAIKHIPQIWRQPISRGRKIHLTGYGIHLLMLIMVLLYPAVLAITQAYPGLVSLFGLGYVFNLSALAPIILFATGQQQIGRSWQRLMPRLIFVMVAGVGLMVNTARAALQILLRRSDSFERTAKFGIQKRRQIWTNKRYQLGLDPIIFWELGLVFYTSWTIYLAWQLDNWAIVIYGSLMSAGLLFVVGMTITHTLAVRWQQTGAPALTPLPQELAWSETGATRSALGSEQQESAG